MCSVTFPFINSSSELAAEITLAVSGFKAGKNPFISRHSLSLGHDLMTFYLPYTTNYNLTNTALCLFSITNTIHFEHYCLANSHILTNFNGTKLDNPTAECQPGGVVTNHWLCYGLLNKLCP